MHLLPSPDGSLHDNWIGRIAPTETHCELGPFLVPAIVKFLLDGGAEAALLADNGFELVNLTSYSSPGCGPWGAYARETAFAGVLLTCDALRTVACSNTQSWIGQWDLKLSAAERSRGRIVECAPQYDGDVLVSNAAAIDAIRRVAETTGLKMSTAYRFEYRVGDATVHSFAPPKEE